MIHRILKIFRALFLGVVVLYGVVVLLLGLPPVQRRLTSFVGQQLEQLLGTNVEISRIMFGYPNRLVLEDVSIDDLEGEQLLEVSRLSAKFEWLPLFREKRISVHTAQVFGLHADLYRHTPEDSPNFQFLLDALASKDTTQEKSSLDLRINSVLIRRGRVCYDVRSASHTPGRFNAEHLAVSNINANISLKSLRNDSINATVKRFELEEQSGLKLTSLQFRLLAGRERLSLSDFELRLPETRLRIDSLMADYPIMGGDSEADSLRVKGEVNPSSYVTLHDLAPLVPAFSNFYDALKVNVAFQMTPHEITMPYLQVRSQKNEVMLHMTDAVTTIATDSLPYLHANLRRLSADSDGLALLYRNMGKADGMPEELQRLEFVHFGGMVAGNINHLSAQGLLETGIGDVRTEAVVQLLPEHKMVYNGWVASERLDLKRLLGEGQKLGDIAFSLNFKGNHTSGNAPSVYLQGELPTLQYSGYTYQNICMDGTFNQRGFNGLISLEDPNAALRIEGEVDVNGKIPSFNLSASIDHFRPNALKLTEDRVGCEYSLNLRAHFSGNNPDNIDGEIDIDSLTAIVPDDFYYMENLHARAQTLDKEGHKRLTVNSDFMQAELEGKYAYHTLPTSFVRIVERYLPSLFKQESAKAKSGKLQSNNNFKFSVSLFDSNFYPYVLGLPLKVRPAATLSGYVNDAEEKMLVEGNVPELVYGKGEYESGVLRCGNTDGEMMASVSFSKQMSGDSRLTMSMLARGADDRLNARLSWGNDTEVTYCGSLDADMKFSRAHDLSPYLRTDIKVNPTELILNDTVWNLRESDILVDSGKVYIDNFRVEHEGQHLLVNGCLTPDPKDSLIVDLNRIAVEYILDIVRFDAVRFSGKATGKVFVSGALGDELKADTRLHVENFHFNNGLMGDMDVAGRWDSQLGVVLDADIREADLGRTTVKGNVSPMEDGLDLHIGVERTNLAFLNSFVGGIFANVKGRASGGVHLHGPFKALNLEGDVLADASAKVKVLNANFTLVNDSVHFRDGYIRFPNAQFFDPEGHRGVIDGQLTHTHLGRIGYDFRITADNLLFYDTEDFGDMLFYGSFYGTGTATLRGGGNTLRLNADLRTDRGTVFVYNMSTPDEITDSRFVTFVDKTPRPVVETRPLRLFSSRDKKEKDDDGDPLQLHISAVVDATSDAAVKVLMDTRSGDYVSVNGNGLITVDYKNDGVNMRGTYDIEGGVYKMSMQDVIRKDLQIQPGSQVTFGESGGATLDLKTIYTVNSASLSDLVPDVTFNQNTVKVNCLINLTGSLSSPTLSFDLDLPTVNDEEMQLVRSAISTDEQMRMQILYLLGVGKFYTYDYANTEGRSSSDAMSSLLSSTLSGQLNNILSQAIDMSNWDFSSNLSTGQEGWSDLEVEGILSGRLLDNRLLINGNFGYRENQLANSNFVGDFNLQWLLTRSGDLSLKFYNQTNDRYFAKTTFNTQGVGIIYKREFDHWRDFFKRKKKKEKGEKEKAEDEKKEKEERNEK